MIAVRRTQAQYGGGRTWKRGHKQANWRATVPTLGPKRYKFYSCMHACR